MKREFLESFGLDKDTIDKIMDENGKDINAAKGDLETVTKDRDTWKNTVGDRDKQLEDLKKSAGDNAELQKQITDLQKANADQAKIYEEQIKQLKLDNAIELALTGANARNTKAVKAMLDLEKVKLGSDGKLSGLDDQIEALKKSDAYMFNIQESKQPQFQGFQPGVASVPPTASTAPKDPSTMTYSEMLDYMEKNPGVQI